VVNKEELAELLDVVRLAERRRDTLEERIEAVEARREIADLVMLYGWLCDAGEWDELLEHYTDDFERTLLGTLDEKVKGKDKSCPGRAIVPGRRRPSGSARTRSATSSTRR
jgi:hypothetical protein